MISNNHKGRFIATKSDHWSLCILQGLTFQLREHQGLLWQPKWRLYWEKTHLVRYVSKHRQTTESILCFSGDVNSHLWHMVMDPTWPLLICIWWHFNDISTDLTNTTVPIWWSAVTLKLLTVYMNSINHRTLSTIQLGNTGSRLPRGYTQASLCTDTCHPYWWPTWTWHTVMPKIRYGYNR